MNYLNVRMSNAGIEFLKRFRINRLKQEIDKDVLSNAVLFDLIVKYFKNNNDEYLKIVNMEIKNV